MQNCGRVQPSCANSKPRSVGRVPLRGVDITMRESTPLCGHREDCSPCVRAAASTLPTAAVGIPPGPRLCARILRFGALGSGSGSSPRLGMEYANRKFGRKRVGMSKCFSTETLDSFVPLAMFFLTSLSVQIIAGDDFLTSPGRSLS